MGGVTGDVAVVIPVDDIVEPIPPNGLTAAPVLVIAPGGFVDSPDPVTPSGGGMPDPVTPNGVVMLVEPGEVIIEELDDPTEDVLGVDMLELIDVDRGDVGAVGVDSIEVPLLPSVDPGWMLPIGLQGNDVVLVGTPEVGFGGTWATAVDAQVMVIQMNRGSFIIHLLTLRLCDSWRSCASRQPHGMRLLA